MGTWDTKEYVAQYKGLIRLPRQTFPNRPCVNIRNMQSSYGKTHDPINRAHYLQAAVNVERKTRGRHQYRTGDTSSSMQPLCQLMMCSLHSVSVVAGSQQELDGQWFPKLMAEPRPSSGPNMLLSALSSVQRA